MKTIDESAKEFEKENGKKIWYSVEIDNGPLLAVESFKAGAKEAQRWISVDEELPEKLYKVLVKGYISISIEPVVDLAIFRNGEFRSYYYGSKLTVIEWRPIERK